MRDVTGDAACTIYKMVNILPEIEPKKVGDYMTRYAFFR